MSSVACGKRAGRRSGVSAGYRTDARGGGAMQVESVRVAVRRRCAWAGGRGRGWRVRARGAPAEAVRLEVLLRLGAHLVRRVLALQAQAHGGGAKVRFGGSAAGGEAGATGLRGRLDYCPRQCIYLVYPPHAEPRILEPAKSRANQKRGSNKKKAPRRGGARTTQPAYRPSVACMAGSSVAPSPVPGSGFARCSALRIEQRVAGRGCAPWAAASRSISTSARAARAQRDRGSPGLPLIGTILD